jgi:hypothetical protein
MIPDPTSLPTILELLKETLRLAREKRRETSRLLRQSILGFSPLIILFVILLVVYLVLRSGHPIPQHTTPKHATPDIGNILKLGALALFILALLSTYLIWLGHSSSKILARAMEIALATVDDRETLFVKRAWAIFRMGILLAAPLGILESGLKYAGLEAFDVQILSPLPFLFLYLSLPAVMESGLAMDAIGESWRLARKDMLFVFQCAFIAWIPTHLLSTLVSALPISKSILGVIQLFLALLTLVFTIKYEPFYMALIYRALKPKEEVVLEPVRISPLQTEGIK